MAIRPALRVSLLICSLVAIPLPTESFILPFSTSKVGLQHPAASQLPGSKNALLLSQPERRQSRRQRPNFRQHVLGPDGKEIDVRRHREAYSHPEYWEDFYTGGDAGELASGESYDWFFGYSRLAVYLNLHIGGARQGRVLVIGCGNSEVSPKMYEDGWKNILNIDFCKPVIEAMEKVHSDKLGMEWKVMDARDMSSLETASFDAVIDKGLTDSIMHNDKFALMMAQVSFEIARVLKPGGVYLMTDYRDSARVQEIFKRDEWEGGTLTQEGKITPTVNLFKGKRSEVELKDPFASTMAEIDEGKEDQEDEGEAPDGLSDAIADGVAKLRMEENLEGVDVPAEKIGRKKPFKF